MEYTIFDGVTVIHNYGNSYNVFKHNNSDKRASKEVIRLLLFFSHTQ